MKPYIVFLAVALGAVAILWHPLDGFSSPRLFDRSHPSAFNDPTRGAGNSLLSIAQMPSPDPPSGETEIYVAPMPAPDDPEFPPVAPQDWSETMPAPDAPARPPSEDKVLMPAPDRPESRPDPQQDLPKPEMPSPDAPGMQPSAGEAPMAAPDKADESMPAKDSSGGKLEGVEEIPAPDAPEAPAHNSLEHRQPASSSNDPPSESGDHDSGKSEKTKPSNPRALTIE